MRLFPPDPMKKTNRPGLLIKRTLLFGVLAVAAIAQTSSQLESDEVKRVGIHLKCTCGCNDNLNCNMSSGQCHICKPARAKIFQMQQSGMSDDSIVASFVKSGEFTLLSDPNSYFWVVPYFSLVLGGVVVWVVLRRLRGNRLTPATAGGPASNREPDNDPVFARYRDAIEKDTEKLD
jgi:cytochrome c-type biogenesis protein CcmH/NrfF